MGPNRRQRNRGRWPRKATAVKVVEAPRSSKTTLHRGKDAVSSWTDTDRVVEREARWAGETFDALFLEKNAKILEWDDYGALESLKKAQNNAQIGARVLWDDYLREAEAFLAPIDFDTRWCCTLAECADDFYGKKNAKTNWTRRHRSDSSNAVILGLPELKDDIDNPSLNAIDIPIIATGWGDEKSVSEPHAPDSPTQRMAILLAEEVELKSSGESCLQPETNAQGLWVTGAGRPECPSSYKFLAPSGWEDVQIDPPVISEGWKDLPAEPFVDSKDWQPEMNARDLWVMGAGRPECPSSYKFLTPSGWGDVQVDPPIIPTRWGDFPDKPLVDSMDWSSFQFQRSGQTSPLKFNGRRKCVGSCG